MAKSENQKQKLLLIKDMLEAYTDENHTISMQQILDHLSNAGIHAERKSIYHDLACLTDYGMDIVTCKGKNGGLCK